MNRKIWRKIRKPLLLLSLCALAALVIAVWVVGGKLVAPANRIVGPPPASLAAVSTTLGSESRSCIAAWFVPAENATATVILLHPIRCDRRAMLSRARLFHKAGYAVLLIDMQAHGESPGDNITVGYQERHDVHAAIEYVRGQNPSHRIAVVGRSLGGAAALLGSPLGIDALVLESVYPTIEEAVSNRVAMRLGGLSRGVSPLLLCQLKPRLGFNADELRPIDHVANAACPVLIAAGDMDQHTTLAETQRMFDTASEPKQLLIFPGAAHTDLHAFDSDRYTTSVLTFLQIHLGAVEE